MPRKRIIPQEDLEQTAAEAVEQSGMEEAAVPPDSPFQEMDTSGNGPPLETGEAGGILLAPEDSPGLSGESDEDAPEVCCRRWRIFEETGYFVVDFACFRCVDHG